MASSSLQPLPSVVTWLMSYYDQRANYALKWSWTRSNKGCRNPVLHIQVAPTILQAIDVYMHWVILGMELECQALGYIHLT